jgi:hypothetical protein
MPLRMEDLGERGTAPTFRCEVCGEKLNAHGLLGWYKTEKGNMVDGEPLFYCTGACHQEMERRAKGSGYLLADLHLDCELVYMLLSTDTKLPSAVEGALQCEGMLADKESIGAMMKQLGARPLA